MRRTEIICTLGPSSDGADMLRKLVAAGMDTARLNMSHGTHEEHQKRIDCIKEVRNELSVRLPILLDTKGPEYRVGIFKDGHAYVADGCEFIFTSDDVVGDEKRVSVSYKDLPKEMHPKDIILVNDGLVKFEVLRVEGNNIICNTLIGGMLSNRKSMSFPGKTLKQVYLSQADKDDILFGIKNDVEFVACSFVSTAQDVIDVRNFLDENGGEKVRITAKIENQSGVDNAEEILKYCSGLMVARGDLGVEVPLANLPVIQKRLIRLCQSYRKYSITATEMLESMIYNPRPTRAEVNDVANAVFDGSNAVMLSGETASGKYPIEAVKIMAEVAQTAEDYIY